MDLAISVVDIAIFEHSWFNYHRVRLPRNTFVGLRVV